MELVVGKNYRVSGGVEYELTAVGYFNVLVINHASDEEFVINRDTFIRDFEEVPDAVVITLYRYTLKISTCLFQTEWTDRPADYFTENSSNVVLKTETKEVEI